MIQTEKAAEKREAWVDGVKVVACVLVTLGHFFQSMVNSDILIGNDFLMWFDESIYFFHVQLFFMMSGYLHQKRQKFFSSARAWLRNALNKLVNLGIPYFTFGSITIALKWLAEDSVNGQVNGLFYGLFVVPQSPYWYLFALFFMFLLVPPIKSRKALWVIVTAAVSLHLAVSFLEMGETFYTVKIVARNLVWFVLGMAFRKAKMTEKLNAFTCITGMIFIPASVIVYTANVQFCARELIMGFLGCLMVISVMYLLNKKCRQSKLSTLLTEYTFPVFLMHTIFAAGFRILLLKCGITSAVIHLGGGIFISFAGPMLAAWVMHQLKYPEYLLYPEKSACVKKFLSVK